MIVVNEDKVMENIEEEIQRRDERLRNNCYNVGHHRIRGRRYYNRLKEELTKNAPDETTIGKTFNLNKEESHRMILAAGIPSLAALVPTAAGAIGFSLASLTLLLNIGAELPPESEKILQQILGFTEDTGYLFFNSLGVAIKGLILPLTAGTLALPKTIIENRKAQKRDEIIDEMCIVDDLITLITDLKRGNQDLSLNFISDFLSSVDISQNKSDFNLELLYKFVEYRNAVLRTEHKEAKKGKETEAFMDIIEFLDEATVRQGAAKTFINDPYVKNLVDTYTGKKETENLKGKSKIKLFK